MHCGRPIASRADSVLEVRKVVSVLSCDLVGSTAAGERLDPEDVSDVLLLYHRTARSIVEQFGGVVEKFVGDAVFAVFGVPVVHEDDAERTVRAALAICSAAAGLPGLGEEALHVRCGVTTGEALIHVGVDATSGEGFVTGTAANLAGRLQGLAPVDGVVVDEGTFRLTQGIFDYAALEPATVKGASEPLEIFHARAPLVPLGAERRLELPAPLVGRESELGVLTAAYDDVVATGRAAIITISGEPGLGKSRLISALRERVLAGDPEPLWRIGRALPYGGGVGVWAFTEILKSHASVLESDDAATTLAKLDATLPDVPDRGWIRQRLLPMLGLGAASSSDREELLAAFRRFIELLARDRPAVVVFEDVHWADDALLAFLGQFAEQPASVPLLVVATTRPELLEQSGPAVDALVQRVVHLAPLKDADVASLAAALLDPATLSPEVEETILRNAGGNALYAGEFVRLLIDRDALVQDGGILRMAAGETLVVPDSTQALIAARLDILPAAQRGVLGDAAVVGGTFWAGALAAMGGRPVEQVLEVLESLARRHLVAFVPRSTLAGETELRFTHVLVRDGAYAQLTRRDRAEKHHAVARWIEDTSGDRVADVVDILAYHTCTTLDLRPNSAGASDDLRASALRYSALAAERNVSLDTKAAAAHLRRALALSENGPGHTHLLALSGQIALQEGRLEEAVDVLERAVAAFQEEGDPRAATRTMIPLAYVYEHLGSARGLDLAEEAVALLEGGPSCVELLDALSLSVATRTIGGDPRAGIESAERAFAVAAELGIDRPTMALGYRGLARFYLGDIDGVDDVREAALLGALRGEGRDAAIVYQNLLMLEHIARGPAASLEAQAGALEFSSTRGLTEMVTFARMGALDPLLDLGRLEELLVLAGELERHATEIGSDYVLMYIRAALLRAWAQLGDHGRVDEAADWIEVASRQTGAPEDLVAGIAACAIARYAVGQDEPARALVEELLAAGAGSVWNLALRLPGLVRAAARAGDIDLARRLCESPAHDSPYARAAMASARGVLAELSGDPATAAAAYAEGARCFERLGVPLEQWLALCGAERALRATGDAVGADAAASTARAVSAAMPSGALLRAGSQAGA